jgi:enoyl reductase-like protein
MIEEGNEWELHQKSRTHRKLVSRTNRLESGQPRHAIVKAIEGRRTGNEASWEDLDESVMSMFPP